MLIRKRIGLGLLVLVGVSGLVWALLPAPVPVGVTKVVIAPFEDTVREEGRTRLRDIYTVSAPIAGYLHRVRLEEGDVVEANEPLFGMEPLPAPALDARAREQARENLETTQARLSSIHSILASLESDARFAEAEYRRHRELFERGAIAATEMDRIEAQRERAQSSVQAGVSAVESARSEVDNARVVLEIASGQRSEFDEEGLLVRAPVSGVVLERMRCCEGTVNAGEPVLMLGNLDDLEVQVDLLSMDAVQVHPGMSVRLTDWGRESPLQATVRRMDPAGFTKVSALGVDEQRVPVILELDTDQARAAGLAVGYRVEAEFLLWQDAAVLQVPTSALFRQEGQWSVYVVEGDRARHRAIEVGRRSGFVTQVLEGLEAGETVVTRPGDRVRDGGRVRAERYD